MTAGAIREPPDPVEVRLMDGFELVCDGEPVQCPLTAQRLLAFLGLHDRPLQRLFVAGKLWTDSTEERALASLRSAIYRANRPAAPPLVRVVDSRLLLDAEVRVDVREASAQAHRLIDGEACEDASRAGALLGGELLPDWYDDWLIIERERFRQLRLHGLEALSARLLERERFGEAAEAALSAIAGEPLRESAHRALIRVHLAEGNPSEALRHFELFRRMLQEELGLAPSVQLVALVREVGDGRVTPRRQAHVRWLRREPNGPAFS
jgi:DNA-binding SARP family transcriptional activator